jgi:60 kDa SS-A/Ro ribonucleoprotein
MAWITLRTEPRAIGLAFDDHVEEFDLAGVETLEQLRDQIRRNQSRFGGGTDCAQPILHAEDRYGDVDAFVLYTDEETWRGTVHPIEALRHYRGHWDRPARMVSTAFVATTYSLVNPARRHDPLPDDDAGVLAVTGFDSAAPAIISSFLRSGDWTQSASHR